MKSQTKQRRKRYTAEFYRGNHIAFFFALLSTILISLLNLGIAWLMQQMIDAVSGVEGTYTLPQLAIFTAIIIVLVVAIKGINYFSKPRFVKKAMSQYKNTAFAKLTQKSIHSFNQESTANYLSALTNDASAIESGYVELVFDLLFDLVLLIGAILMMLWYSPLLTLVAIGFFLLPIGASLLTGVRMERVELKVSKKNEAFVSFLKDSLAGFPVIKSFKAEKATETLFQKENASLEQVKCERRKISGILGILGSVAGFTAQFGTFLVGMALALSGFGITPGILLIFVDLTGSVIRPIAALPDYLAKRKAAIALIDKLAAALETNVRDEGEDIPARLTDGIRLKNVGFGYSEGQAVLHEISTCFEAGKSYAIVGASGSGKSTLLNLLMGSHSTYSGEITYDGHELRHISSEALYDITSIIQQNVFVFDDTLRNNITMFRQFPEEAVKSAVEKSGLSELIDAKGEDYQCGENGNKLSGGEKQRLSIARSLLRETPVLLVDEATASLDRDTAYHVMDSILNLGGLTRIVVTHALDEAVLRRYDQILVLKKGYIVEQGQFDDLMENKSDFYALYTTAQ